MILTEEEAVKKVCNRVAVCTEIEVSTSGNQRRFYEPMPLMCVGSDCAKWRWEGGHESRRFIRAESQPLFTEPVRPDFIPTSYKFVPSDCDCDSGWQEPGGEADKRRCGYCGRGGKP